LGKSAPTPPPAPDPTTIIGAQSTADQDSALLQSKLNNVQYQGPQGSVAYSLSPSDQWTENVSLNPTAQATYAQTGTDEYNASKLAGQQLGLVGDALQQGLSAPSLKASAPTGNLATGYNSGGPIQYGYNAGGPIQSQVSATYPAFGGAPAQGGAGQTAGASAAAPAQDPRLAGLAAEHPGDNTAQLQFLAQHPNPGAKGQAYLASIASPAGGLPAPAPQSANPAAVAPQSSPLAQIASNPVLGTQLATYAQAKQLLDPQWSQAAEQQQAQLTAQGLNPNDAAYQNAMQIFGSQQNQAYDQAIFNAVNAGDSEQNALFGQNISAGQFANQAQAQQYGENQGLAQFNNSAQAQANGQNAASAAFNNQALGQNWQEQYSNAQLANSAAQQQFQDQAYAQELPVNEFTALMGNSQVGMPPAAPAQNTTVGVPNAANAYQLQQQGQQFAYNANQQNAQSGLNGLFSLGSSVLGLIPGL